ncbi:hypothetical protein [Yeosuana marina]|uniref:hypothetical protein n=1 Tax=Yeosuana marina TaxID=1565536 RepID=UPI0030C87C80
MEYIKTIINWVHSFGGKKTEELSINIDESDFTILTSGSYKINTKINKYYGGGDFSFVDGDNTINYWLNAKNTEELLLEKKKKSFFERVAEVLDNLNPNQTVGRDDISQYSEEELITLLNDWNLDAYSYARLSQDFGEIKNSKRLIRSFENRIKSILGNIRKRLRNFKEVYKRQHSFHFKNLDDYHALILINRIRLIKV